MGDDWERALDKDDETKFLEVFLPPRNCGKMQVPRVDEHLWRKLEDKQRKEDKSLQDMEHLLLQSQFALLPAMEYFLKKEGGEEDKILGLLQKSAQISSFLNKKLVAKRRMLLRPHLEEKYKVLAKRDLPVTEHLFGEDLEKKVENLDKTKDIIEKPRKIKPNRNKFSRQPSVPGYQQHLARFQRFPRTEEPNRASPFLEGGGGRRGRHFNQSPKKQPNMRSRYQAPKSHFQRSYNK